MSVTQVPQAHDGGLTPPARRSSSTTGAHPALKMLALPERGDRVAYKWWASGIIAYAALSLAIVGALLNSGATGGRFGALAALFGLGRDKNWAVFVLVAVGVGLTIYTALHVLRDIRKMSKEETDIDWVSRTGKAGLHLVFVDPDKREKLLGRQHDIPEGQDVSVETLLDDRVRRVHVARASADGGAVVPEELRGIAEVRTAQYGGFARYVSSLLLLLAVLGTFAGVKTALPGLIDSIAVTTSAGAAASSQGLVRSLQAVAGAFGGNALALIGAIAIGLMAQGVGFGRRNLLERLELVSAEFVYGNDVAADTNPMQAAIVALRETAREMHSASGSMMGIEDGLQGLGTEFRASFNRLADRLHDIAGRQEEGLYDKTADSLNALQHRVNELAAVIEGNARTYAGLAEAVRTRTNDSTTALQHMQQTNEQLGNALGGILTVAQRSDDAFRTLHAAVNELAQGSTGMGAQLSEMIRIVDEVRPAMASLERAMASADERLRASEKHSREEWERMTTKLLDRMNEGVERAKTAEERAQRASEVEGRRGAVTVSTERSSDPETTRLLREIATSVRQPSGISPVAATLLPLLGAAVGGGGVYLLIRYL